MPRRAATLGVSAVLAVGLGAGAAQLPVPYIALAPGDVYDTLGTIEVDGREVPLISVSPADKRYAADGKLDLTTVSVYGTPRRGIRLGTALSYWFDPDVAVVPREVIYPEDKTDEQVDQEVREEMTRSQESATVAAFRELGIEGTSKIVVRAVTAGQPADGRLRPEDEIRTVDGRPVRTFDQLRAELGKRRPGQPAVIGLVRAGTAQTVSVPTVASTDGAARPTLGIEVREDRDYPIDVTIRTNDVGGPSAGLMFALGIIELLTPGSLTGGAHVAGTGTIDDNGDVGPIGGIQQKVVGARDAGAEYFLTPADNFADAEAVKPDGLELIRVATLKEALAALARIRAEADRG